MLPTGSPSWSDISAYESRRIGHQHLEQPLPPPGQAGQGLANGLGALVGEQPLVDRRLVRGTSSFSVTSSSTSTTLFRAARLRRHSFRAVAASQEPDPGRVLEPVDVLEQAQPRRPGRRQRRRSPPA